MSISVLSNQIISSLFVSENGNVCPDILQFLTLDYSGGTEEFYFTSSADLLTQYIPFRISVKKIYLLFSFLLLLS